MMKVELRRRFNPGYRSAPLFSVRRFAIRHSSGCPALSEWIRDLNSTFIIHHSSFNIRRALTFAAGCIPAAAGLTVPRCKRIVRHVSRRALVFLSAAVAAVVAVALMFYFQVDRVVKRAIEHYGSAATQSAVRVDAVEIALSSGTGSIDGITVANPTGFSTAPAFSLGKVHMVIDTATVRSDPVVVNEIVIEAPQVRFEVDQHGEANLDIIRRNVQRYTDGDPDAPVESDTSAAAPPADEPPPRVEQTPERRLVIKRLAITAGQVEIDAPVLGGTRRVVTLPDTEVLNVGEDSGGVTGPELATIVVVAMLHDVATTVAATKVQEHIEHAIGGEAGKAIGKGVGEAMKGLGGVLNDVFQE